MEDINKPIELSLEQQFELRSFSDKAMQMSEEQAKSFLLTLYRHMMIRETMYKELLGHDATSFQ